MGLEEAADSLHGPAGGSSSPPPTPAMVQGERRPSVDTTPPKEPPLRPKDHRAGVS